LKLGSDIKRRVFMEHRVQLVVAQTALPLLTCCIQKPTEIDSKSVNHMLSKTRITRTDENVCELNIHTDWHTPRYMIIQYVCVVCRFGSILLPAVFRVLRCHGDGWECVWGVLLFFIPHCAAHQAERCQRHWGAFILPGARWPSAAVCLYLCRWLFRVTGATLSGTWGKCGR